MAVREAPTRGSEHPQTVSDNLVSEKFSTPPTKASSGSHPDELSDTTRPRSSSTENQPSMDRKDDVVADAPTGGSPLDQVPSQAQKPGKKKIAVVMGALCVCFPSYCLLKSFRGRDADRYFENAQLVLFLAALDMVCTNSHILLIVATVLTTDALGRQSSLQPYQPWLLTFTPQKADTRGWPPRFL